MIITEPSFPKTTAPPRQPVLRRNLRICTWEGMASLPIMFLAAPANFLITALLTKNFGLSAGWFGLIVSLPAWSNVLQLGLTPLLSRRFRPRTLNLAGAWLHLACWLLFTLALPLLDFAYPTLAGLFFVLFFALSSALSSVIGVSWTSWIQEWIPARARGRYFGNRNRLITLGTVAFLLTAGKLLGWFGGNLHGYQVLLLAAIVLRVGSILGQHRISQSAPKQEVRVERYRWRDYPRILRQSDSIFYLILFGGLYGFATGLIGPFYNVFMYKQLGLTVTEVSWLAILASTGGALSFPVWGRLLKKFGNLPIMILGLVLWQVQNYLWCLLTPGNAAMLYPMWVWDGIMSAGFALASFNLLLKLMPVAVKTTGISLHLSVTSLCGAIAPILGGQLFTWSASAGFDMSHTYRLSFLIQPTLCLAGILILLKIREPDAANLRQVIRALRSPRQIAFLLGLPAFANKSPSRLTDT